MLISPSKVCQDCNRVKQKDSLYCWFCDPETSDEEKQNARTKGGYLSKRVSSIDADTVLPITDIAGLIDYYNQIIRDVLAMPNSLKRAKVLSDIGAKLAGILELQHIISLDDRLRVLEATKVIDEAQWQQLDSSN